jgi:hypothetical protein
MRYFRSEFHVPIKSTQAFASSEQKYLPDGIPPARLDFKEIARWLRRHLRGRRHVNVELLKAHVQNLTESQWLAAVGEAPVAGRRLLRSNAPPEIDLAMIADPRSDPSETVYLRQLLSIVEDNLMSDDIPYFRALIDKTPAKALAIALDTNPSTTSKRMKQVRAKVQSIIMALNRGDSS